MASLNQFLNIDIDDALSIREKSTKALRDAIFADYLTPRSNAHMKYLEEEGILIKEQQGEIIMYRLKSTCARLHLLCKSSL